ncbi:class III lanthionine synthetase LanKC [Streptomyces sp. URMC 123]|uniref:class III lanthionine synthetase LanKC n=1 Tax=Streptomyces sp. URMC 123 TaxID=3423403 RepID=UPI003F1CF402
MLDFRFLEFCRPDMLFYDAPDAEHADDDYDVPVPDGWGREVGQEWTVFRPKDLKDLPEQGWKIHVSATPATARVLLDTVVPYLVEHNVWFKFIRSEAILDRRGSKYGDRSASGKFFTIYPVDDAHCERLLNGLQPLVDGTPGPYLLSDLRWKQGPLYVRYGAYALKWTRDGRGQMVPAIQHPDGHLVPDERRPVFRPPAWLEIPPFLQEAIEERKKGTLAGFPFKVTKALHFSNGGGVYRATDTRTGEEVLLREARPYAGLDLAGNDAVSRLKREHWALKKLQGLDCVPRLVDRLNGHQHHYLAREFVNGESLKNILDTRHPYVNGTFDRRARLAHRDWALSTLEKVEEGLQAIHDRGVVFGDLHPANVLVRDDGSIQFIDLEGAIAVGDPTPQAMGALGFKAPDHLTGPDIDRFALAVMKLALFIPAPHVVQWGSAKVRQLTDLMVRSFDVPDDFVASILEWLNPEHLKTATEYAVEWPDHAEQTGIDTVIARSVISTATPERTDRLFPGDAVQFLIPGGGVTFAHGAAGVLWALAATGHTPPKDHVRWLIDQVTAGVLGDGPGFATGAAGVSYALAHLGERDMADRVLDVAIRLADEEGVTDSFASGRAGLGLALADRYQETGEERWLVHAVEQAKRMSPPENDGPVGLLHGRTGPALLHLYLHRVTGEDAFAERAAAELSRDLVTVEKAPRIGPGLAGTGGISIVTRAVIDAGAADLADAHTELVRSLDQLDTTPGLWSGRAGTVLARVAHRLPTEVHVESLSWDAVATEEGRVDFIGERGFRLSTDLATGSCSALLALRSARRGTPVFPFLGDLA